MFLSPGATLDKYEIVAPLAVGGMAELYVARAKGPQGFEKLCVIKRILTQHARDEEFVKMFLDEARLAATLRHPNVIQVYDVGSVKGRYYFAMEYVHGQDLASIVSTARAARRGLRIGNALEIVVGAAAGLHHAHEQVGPDGVPLRIVHRDVSPANILVSYDGHVKVVDFGIAKAAARATRTTVSGFKGKLCYMSPEQVQARPDLDRRSDVFSLGVVLYELTTGKPLFRGDSDLLIAEKIVDGTFQRPSEARAGYDARLEEIVMTALARDPKDRFPTTLAMQLALEEYARSTQLVLSDHALGDFMRELFATRIESWELAKKQGRSLAEFVRSTAELSALNIPEEPPSTPTTKPWWKKPSAIIGAAAVVLAIVGWGIVLARGGSNEQSAPVPPVPVAAPAAVAPTAGAPIPAVTPPGAIDTPLDKPVEVPVAAAMPEVKAEPAPAPQSKRDKRRRDKSASATARTKTADKPADKPVDKPADKPAETSVADKPADPPADKPAPAKRSLDKIVNPFDVVKKPKQ